MLKIDMHTHIMPEHLPNWAAEFGYDAGFIHLDHHRKGFARMMQGDRFFREVASNCWNAAERIPQYAASGTQVQLVCTIPVLFAYAAKPADGLRVAMFLNDHIASIIAEYPKHYIGLATLPMQDIDLAVQELERCKSLGFVGIQIGSNINKLNLHEPQFYPLWAACERLNMAVMVHPWEMMGEQDMQRYWLPWLVGMPAETTRAICSMLLGGVFDRFPKLRVCFSHAGGSFFATLGRIEHGYHCRPDLVAIDTPHPPSHYLNRFWIDNITHDAATLRYIMQHIGSDKICLGSDFPFPLGDLTIGQYLYDMGLPDTDLQNILAHSTLSWLDLTAVQFDIP
jgi:aminocarboxymuconate-semialdehyde decarboxylase